MAEETADDIARELLFTTTSEREAHEVALEALLARNAALRTNEELIAEELRTDPGFRDEWRWSASGRAVATVLVRYRSVHDLSQRELANRLLMTQSEVARLELGEDNPSTQALLRLYDRLGVEVVIDVKPPGVE